MRRPSAVLSQTQNAIPSRGKKDSLKRDKDFIDAIAVMAADSLEMGKDVVPILKLSGSLGIRRVWLAAETAD
jgi:hypothetical protein